MIALACPCWLPGHLWVRLLAPGLCLNLDTLLGQTEHGQLSFLTLCLPMHTPVRLPTFLHALQALVSPSRLPTLPARHLLRCCALRPAAQRHRTKLAAIAPRKTRAVKPQVSQNATGRTPPFPDCDRSNPPFPRLRPVEPPVSQIATSRTPNALQSGK